MTDFDTIELKKWSIRKMLVYTAGVLVACSTFVWGVSEVVHSIRDSITQTNNRIDIMQLKQDANTQDIAFIKKLLYKPRP